MGKTLIFSFDDLSTKDKAVKALGRLFQRAGAPVAQYDVNPAIKRSSGVSYRELGLTFADSQQVLLRIKQTGDIFQVLVNGKVHPLRSPDDHPAAISEVTRALDGARAAFQKKLAAAKVALPPSIRTAAPKMMEVMLQKRDALKDAVQAATEELSKLKGQAA